MKVCCEFCKQEGDFLNDRFEQLVIRLEEGYDWTGDLALACSSCTRKYKEDLLKTTQDGREVASKAKRERIAQGFASANPAAANTFTPWKPRLGEGERWVEAEKKMLQDRADRAELRSRGIAIRPSYNLE
jgi:hypothetical protein